MSVKQVQAIVNGQTYTLTYNSNTGKYEATATAPSRSSYSQSGHYYGITIKATDDAGNVTTKDATDSAIGSSLRLTVKEKAAPVITVTNPTASATQHLPITNRLSHGASQMMILVLIRLLSVSQSIPEVRLLTALQRPL